MSETNSRCESCGMPVDAGRYCEHCVDESGRLQDFDTRFARMVSCVMRKDTHLSRPEAERQTIAYMSTMPAWREHPTVVARRQS
jgi:hypothetical protein